MVEDTKMNKRVNARIPTTEYKKLKEIMKNDKEDKYQGLKSNFVRAAIRKLIREELK